jgi:hypothetical protein
MDLRQVVPQVPENIEQLKQKNPGLYVVTLQIWLKLLGWDCGKIDGNFNTVKEQLRLFKQEQMPLNTNPETDDDETWKKMDELLRAHLPPDPETIERLPFPMRSDFDSEEAYRYAIKTGLERFGFRLSAQLGTHYLAVDESGMGMLEKMPPGIYEMELVDELGTATGSLAEYQENAGSLEVKLFDEQENPRGGKVKLTNQSPEPEALEKAIRLFKAVALGADKLKNRHRKLLNKTVINGQFSDADRKLWNEFKGSWGQFYGAPWMGTFYDPVVDDRMAVNTDNNWTTYETAMMLYQWGQEQLKSKANPNYRMVAVRHLNQEFGGLVSDRLDFSQTGQAVSLHLPRKTSRKTGSVETGQDYGLIDYQSEEYHRPAFELMFKNQLKLDSEYLIKCPDEELVTSLIASETQWTQGDLVFNRYLSNNTELTKESSRKIRILVKVSTETGDAKFPVAKATVQVKDVNGQLMDLRTQTAKSEKGKIEKAETDWEGQVVLPRKYLRKDNKDTNAPYQVVVTTTEDVTATHQVLGKVGNDITFNSIGTYFDYRTDEISAGLYELKNKTWSKIATKEAYLNHRLLIEDEFLKKQLLPKLKCPFDLDENQELKYAEDDLFESPLRQDLPHYGIDIGTRVRKKNEQKYTSLNTSTPVKPIVREGYIYVGLDDWPVPPNKIVKLPLTVKQKVLFAKDNFRLVLYINYGHVLATTNSSDWAKTVPYKKDQAIGELFPNTSGKYWEALTPPYILSDNPKVVAEEQRKGHHIHLSIEGIYELGIAGLENREDYKNERKTFYNSILLEQLTKRNDENN